MEHDHGHCEAYDKLDVQGDHDHYDHPDRDQDLYDEMDEENYHNERATFEQREKDITRGLDLEYVRSERSLSCEYEY